MKALLALLVLASLSLTGCSRETRGNLEEFGNDAGRDMKKAGQNVEAAIEDATD